MNKFLSYFTYREKEEYNFDISKKPNNIVEKTVTEKLSSSLKDNLNYIKNKYNFSINSDINIREFSLFIQNKKYSAFLFYIDGMTDTKLVNNFILEPLMLKNQSNTYIPESTDKITIKKNIDIETFIFDSLIPQNSIKKSNEFAKIFSDVNSGFCALFIDTIFCAFTLEVKGFKSRSIAEPNNEIIVRGSQEAFVEVIRTNTSILRRFINNENFIIEDLSVGTITKTKVGVCYLKNIANDSLIKEVKNRISNLKVSSLISSGQLEQLIQDNGNVIFPQIISTERADKATRFILGGRVIVLVNGSPYALVMPATFMDFFSSPEDFNLKFQYANLLKIIRLIAMFFALFLPGFYVAITSYHQELLPTELLFAIVSSRASIPFPIIFEIFIMEISFELIREAGIRVPTPLGPTIGIVGALILGQAAVDASIVSPILIIIVSITGICSFAIPDFSFGFSIRIYRFLYILAGFLGGFLGISFILFFQFLVLFNMKSYGISYLSLHSRYSSPNKNSFYFLPPIWKREKRNYLLNTKQPDKQAKISMNWKYKKGK